MLREANGYFANNEPWLLRKSIRDGDDVQGNSQARLDIVVYIILECIRVAGILLQPVIPSSADLLLSHIHVDEKDRTFQDAQMYGRKTKGADGKEAVFLIGASNFVLFDKKKMVAKMAK